MSKRLIINADDFGLCRAQNYGIECVIHIVSSTTAIVTSPAIEHAAVGCSNASIKHRAALYAQLGKTAHPCLLH